MGPYLDENRVRRYGLYAGLSIAVDDAPSQFRQPDVHEGQTLQAGEYRILVERIFPSEGRGTVVVRVWSP